MTSDDNDRNASRPPDADYASSIEDLRQLWRQAIEDNSPGIAPDEVFERLYRKYRTILGRDSV